jgi:ABC-type branched-subunit amino acid transport system substrate-binding protein
MASLACMPSFASKVTLGMSTALSGPAGALGQGVKLGVEVAFKEFNKNNAQSGIILSLKALDDGYEPKRAAPNMRQFAQDQDILAVIGNVGTPTAIVSVPVVNEMKLPLLGAFTGAGVLRKSPPDRYIFNYRASYAEETASMINGILDSGIKPQEIAFFTQNDGYGDAGFVGASEALEQRGFSKIDSLVHGRYERNTMNVEVAAGMILDSEVEPRVVIMVGAYGPCAELITLVKEELPDLRFINVSFVGSRALKKALSDAAEGVIVTQVVPHFDSDLPGAILYRAAMREFASKEELGFVSFEGYLAAKMFISALKGAGTRPSRESLIGALESLKRFDLGVGRTASFSINEHQASHQVWPTIIRNGRFQAFEWSGL